MPKKKYFIVKISKLCEMKVLPFASQTCHVWAKLWSRRWKDHLCQQNALEVLDTWSWHNHRFLPDSFDLPSKWIQLDHWQNLHLIRWQIVRLCHAKLSLLQMLHLSPKIGHWRSIVYYQRGFSGLQNWLHCFRFDIRQIRVWIISKLCGSLTCNLLPRS